MTSSYSLTSLPVELLMNIVILCCHHCSYNKTFWDHRNPERLQCVKTLYNLSLTCKTLCAIAQPILYHEPRTDAKLRLMLTLVARPDLASQVFDITLDNARRVLLAPNEMELALIQIAAARLGTSLPEPFDKSFTRRFMELLLLLVPNIQEVSYEMEFEDEVSSNLISATGAVFSSLKHLYVNHEQTEGGFSLDKVKHFLIAGPNLEHLALHMCLTVDISLCLEWVRSLRLSCTILGESDIANIIAACPRLESLYYESGGAVAELYSSPDSIEFLPCDLMQALQTRKATLKYLWLDFSGQYRDTRYDPIEEDELFSSFADFPVLQVLILPLESLLTEERIETSYNSEEVVAMLPKSLQFLGLVAEPEYEYKEPVALVVAIENDAFPHLEKVVLKARGEETGRLTDTFAAVGVEYEKYYLEQHELEFDAWQCR
ncbi:hypothetical protein GQ53DRAFT_93031 [Thozetella sp. PMI_491]|nr:hypothetical protein GQ53DRAFT_93031 [Thozetella sp. PMI_491]